MIGTLKESFSFLLFPSMVCTNGLAIVTTAAGVGIHNPQDNAVGNGDDINHNEIQSKHECGQVNSYLITIQQELVWINGTW